MGIGRMDNTTELKNNSRRKSTRFKGMAYGKILFVDYFWAETAQK
jgi:hypothetical protein